MSPLWLFAARPETLGLRSSLACHIACQLAPGDANVSSQCLGPLACTAGRRRCQINFKQLSPALGKPTIRAKSALSVKHLHHNPWLAGRLTHHIKLWITADLPSARPYNPAALRTTCPQ